MSNFEATVSSLEGLSDSQLMQIQHLAKRYKQKSIENPFRKINEIELFEKIDRAITNADKGLVMDANVSVQELREKYGL